MRLTNRIQAASRIPLLQVVKASIATIGAWLLAGWLIPGPLPVFAAIAALLVVQPSVNQSFGKAVERSLGVIIGVLIATGITLVFGQNSWIVLIAIVVAIFASWAFRLTPGTSNQIAISAMLVLALGASSPEYAIDRVIETLIGAAFAFIVTLVIIPPVLVAPAARDVKLLGTELAASFDRLAEALSGPQDQPSLDRIMIEARLLRPMLEKAHTSMAEAEDSLAFNPRRARRAELEQLRGVLTTLTSIVTQLIGMTRTVHDNADDSLHLEPAIAEIIEQLRRSAHDIRLMAESAKADAQAEHPPVTDPIPALTAPLALPNPSSTHWVLIGSLMEDLTRVHGELTGDGN